MSNVRANLSLLTSDYIDHRCFHAFNPASKEHRKDLGARIAL